jgi:hypothetical protein
METKILLSMAYQQLKHLSDFHEIWVKSSLQYTAE